MAAELRGCRPAAYSRRHPEQTVLYRVVQHYLETYLVLAREGDWDGHAVPVYVERDFRRYLECGILAYGFARAYCADCGRRLSEISPSSRRQFLLYPCRQNLL